MSSSDREALNQLQFTTPHIEELDHFDNCPNCGQAIDLRRLGDVLHHDQPGHEPLPLNS